MFQASLSVVVGNGTRALFWEDRWLQGSSVKDIAPHLLHAVLPRVRHRRTVAQGVPNNSWMVDVTGALTAQVLAEFLLVWDGLCEIQLQEESEDAYLWKWTSS
jgi:hypothetical protein